MARPDPTHFKSLLEPAHSIAILLSETPSYDSVASALAFKLALEQADREVTVACSKPLTVEFNRLVGINSIINSFGNRNLIISFPSQTEHVDKVSYNIEQGELQLVVTPKAGAPDLDHTKLHIRAGTGNMDLALTVGVDNLNHLGSLYQNSSDFFQKTKIVSLSQNLPQHNFTSHQVFDPNSSSLSELTAYLLDVMGLALDIDSASNLLAGLEHATDHFRHPSVSPSTFEMAALLVRRGARRHEVFAPGNLPPGSVPSAPYQSSQAGFGTDSTPAAAEPTPEGAVKKPEPSPDWYEPKVYSGNMLP